eukprot:s3161_g1.t1
MRKLLVEFVTFVRIEEGILSKSQVNGTLTQPENPWNFLRHELAKAKQYAKLRAGRTSRISSWMAVQEDLCIRACGEDAADDDSAKALQPVRACRPLSSPEVQFVIFKLVATFSTFHIGMVTSLYRGSVSRTKGSGRRMSLSKPLSAAAPPVAVSKVRVLILESLGGNNMVASPVGQNYIMDIEDVCGEVHPSEQGWHQHKLFLSFSPETMQVLDSLQKGTLIFGKTENAKKPKKVQADDNAKVRDFQMKSFVRGDAGDKNIEKFFQYLPEAFEKHGQKILDSEGKFKIGHQKLDWMILSRRVPSYFDILLTGKSGKDYSNAVFFKLRDCEPRPENPSAKDRLRDSSLCVQGDSLGLLLCRPKGTSRYEINGIFHVTEEQFKQWDSIYLQLLFESASRTARWFVNRPGISDLRSIDRSFYTTLSVQSCRRGLPLLPCPPGEVEDEMVTIADGQALGLDHWIRFDPERYGSDRFYLSQYIRLFLANLNVHSNFPTYNSLDGNQLVSFQQLVAVSGLTLDLVMVRVSKTEVKLRL